MKIPLITSVNYINENTFYCHLYFIPFVLLFERLNILNLKGPNINVIPNCILVKKKYIYIHWFYTYKCF